MNTLLSLALGAGSPWLLGLMFLIAASCVILSGLKLSAYGDALGERTGLGAGLVGLLFLAGVTSLPELVVSTSATLAASMDASQLVGGSLNPAYLPTLIGGADLALGNMLGSNVFNLMIFVLIDLVQGQGSLLIRLSRKHIFTAACGLGMLGILLFGITLENRLTPGASGWTLPVLACGPVTFILLPIYIGCLWLLQRMEGRDHGLDQGIIAEVVDSEERLLSMSATRFYGTLAGLALIIVLCGIWLSQIGDRMSLPTAQGGFGLEESLIGTIFLAIATSLPEMVVSFGAARMRAYDMAAGNVLGSNLFNLVILFAADLGLRGGSLLHLCSTEHLITIAMITILTSILIIGLLYRTARSFARLGFDVWIMLVVYILGNLLLFLRG